MNTINIAADATAQRIGIGNQYENEATAVVFDCSQFAEDHGAGTAQVVHRRPTESIGYVCTNVSQEGNTVTWLVTDDDTSFTGKGLVQLRWYVDEVLRESVIFPTYILPSVASSDDAPADVKSALEQLMEYIKDNTISIEDLDEHIANYFDDHPLPVDGLDTELKDIRVGTDGTVYPSAGDAVRDQVGGLKQDLEELQEEIEGGGGGGGGGGLTDSVKTALLGLAQKVAYIDTNGATYYQNLYDALYPPAGLTRITAVYTQTGTVYDTASLDDLKPDLVVTAYYDNSTSRVLLSNEYTLSGTLVEGTSTITASYSGKSATFNVTVSTYCTAPVIETEGKTWNSSGGLETAQGFGVTQEYGYSFSESTLTGCRYYDSTNDYMSTNGWCGIKYYVSDVKTLQAGYSWPATTKHKHLQFRNATVAANSSISKNALSNWQFVRYNTDAMRSTGVSFSLPMLDLDDCYAYWYKPSQSSILPDGVSDGDIIFAGANTPYYGCHNISEA